MFSKIFTRGASCGLSGVSSALTAVFAWALLPCYVSEWPSSSKLWSDHGCSLTSSGWSPSYPQLYRHDAPGLPPRHDRCGCTWRQGKQENRWALIVLGVFCNAIWVRSQRCICLVTWFCYHLIAKVNQVTRQSCLRDLTHMPSICLRKYVYESCKIIKKIVDWSLWWCRLHPRNYSQKSRHHCGYGLRQWETMLHCNAVSHWLSPYPE